MKEPVREIAIFFQGGGDTFAEGLHDLPLRLRFCAREGGGGGASTL
jgi:hypothetical protein